MIMISSAINEYQVDILCEGVNQPVMLRIALGEPWNIVKVDNVFANARIASATLRDTLALGPAVELLERHGVPRTHPIWDLNHSDLWERPGSAERFEM